MAKQAGPIYITGTIAGMTNYKLDDQFYTRRKSSLSRKKCKTHPAFTRSRASAERFGQANRLASEVFRLVPRNEKPKGLFQQLKNSAIQLIHQGLEPASIKARLQTLLPERKE